MTAAALPKPQLTLVSSRFPKLVDVRDLASTEPAPREWFVDGMLPMAASNLLAANGGLNKTLLVLMLAVCVAMGLPFFGLPTRRSIVMVVLAEDDRAEIHRRLLAICTALGVELRDLAGFLYVYDGLGCDVALFGRRAVMDDRGRAIYTACPELTESYDWLLERCETINPELLILDGVSDMFDAEENRRADVRRYINATLALVLPVGGSVLHVAHVDKFVARGGSANGQTYSGSTAWNNSVRARLSLTRPTSGEGDAGADDGRRILTVEKLNYGAPGLAIPLRYDTERHVLVRDGDVSTGTIVGAIRDRTEQRAILRCLIECASANRNVMTSPRANQNAATMLAPMEPFPKALQTAMGRKRLFTHLFALEAMQLSRREPFTTAARHHAERWVVTPTGTAEANDAA